MSKVEGNNLYITGKKDVFLVTPKGSMVMSWDGKQLVAANGKTIRFTAPKTEEIRKAVAEAAPAEYRHFDNIRLPKSQIPPVGYVYNRTIAGNDASHGELWEYTRSAELIEGSGNKIHVTFAKEDCA